MRRSLLATALVLSSSVGSGALECSVPPQSPVAQHGGDLYRRMCGVCHGALGEGYKADQATALAHSDFLASVTDEFLRTAIGNGRGGTTMSAWSTTRGGPLAKADVDAIIAFIRSWEQRSPVTLDETPRGGVDARGEGVYARECQRCHGARGLGGPNVNIGNPELLKTASDGFLRYAIRFGRSGTPMPGFAATLGDGPIEDVVAFLRKGPGSVAVTPPPPAHPPPIPLGPVPLNPRGPEPEGFKTFPATTPADVIKAQLDRHARMALLDARAPSDYTNEHIAGAVSVPFYDPDPYLAALPRDAWLVCYCACPHAESGTLAGKLQAKGFTKVTVLDEGLGVWRGRKYATNTGFDP